MSGYDTLEASITQLETLMNNSTQLLGDLETALNTQRSNLGAAASDVETRQARITELEAKVAELQSFVDTSGASSAENAAQIASLQEQLTRANTDLEAANAYKAEIEQKLQTLQTRIEAVSGIVRSQTEKISALTTGGRMHKQMTKAAAMASAKKHGIKNIKNYSHNGLVGGIYVLSKLHSGKAMKKTELMLAAKLLGKPVDKKMTQKDLAKKLRK